MRVLVTGASGTIGSRLCGALLERGDEVVGLSRDPGRAGAKQPRVSWHAWEPTLERPAGEAFDGVEGVVNLVGETINQRWDDGTKQRIMESRRTATRNLVATIASLERRPAVLVNQSASGYYGDRGAEIVAEPDPPGETFDAEVVAEWERAAREVESAGVRLVILRSAPVLNTEDGLLAELLLPFKLGLGGPIAGGDQYLSWIHIDDEVGMLLWALDNDSVEGVFNASAPDPVTNREFSKALGRALNRPAVIPVPGFVLDLKFGREFGAILRGGQRVLPKRAEELGYRFKYPALDDALRDLVGDGTR